MTVLVSTISEFFYDFYHQQLVISVIVPLVSDCCVLLVSFLYAFKTAIVCIPCTCCPMTVSFKTLISKHASKDPTATVSPQGILVPLMFKTSAAIPSGILPEKSITVTVIEDYDY